MNGLKENRWRCFCSMSFVEGHFPREGQGFQEGDEAPAFGNKKVNRIPWLPSPPYLCADLT